MTNREIFISLAASLLLSPLANAATYSLEPLEVTSSPLSQNELSATDAVEIYTQTDIEKAHVQNVYEFLNQQTSVFAMPSYGNPFTQKIDMHGYGIGDGFQNVVITINGRRMNNIDIVPQLLSSISPSAISRIEIIKSSGIVTGGDGANAGVINITTKKNNDKELTLYAGNNRTYNGSLYVGHTSDFYSISANAERYHTDGPRDIDAAGDTDEQDLKNGGIDITLTPTPSLEISAGFHATRLDATYGSFLTYDEYQADPTQAGATNWGASEQEYDSDIYDLALFYEINEKWLFNAQASREDKTSNYVTYTSIAEYDYNAATISLNYESGAVNVSVGIDAFDGERNANANKTSKNNIAAYVMSRFNSGNHTFKAGYRYENVTYKYKDAAQNLKDDNTLHGIELGYNYMFNTERSVFASFSRSYQAPDIDRFFNFGGTFNGFINPMKANSFTLGYNAISSRNKFKISAYYVDLEDEIYYYADPTYVNAKNTNIDESHKYGLDIYNKFLVTDTFHVSLNYNYVKAVIDKEIESGENYANNELPGVPNHSAKVTLSYLPNENTTLSLMHTHRSNAYAADDFNNNFAQEQEAYRSTDIAATYAKENYEIFAKINNLFDQSNGLWINDDAIYPINFTTTAIAGIKIKY